ncbi:MAG: PilN domain-containing protein [Thermoleophilia bacterium]|nr:PilN domain-containing protein [Thermoleophilia bacterium]
MKRINLLPKEAKAKASRERGLAYALALLVVLVLGLGAVYVQQSSAVGESEQQLADLQSQTAALQQQIAVLMPYQELQTQRTQMTETAAQIYDTRVEWSNFLEQLSLVIPDNVCLTSLSCAVPTTMLPGSTTASEAATADSTAITFVGQAWTHDDVAEFMTRLGLIPQIQNILLTNSAGPAAQGAETGAAQPGTFTVTAELRPFLTAPPTTVLQEVE